MRKLLAWGLASCPILAFCWRQSQGRPRVGEGRLACRDGQFLEPNPLPQSARPSIPGLAPSHSSLGLLDNLLHAELVQYTEGTQRLEEPVSKMTVKFCGGEPMEMVPKYSIYRQGREGSRVCMMGWGRVLTRGPREGCLGPESPG